MLFPYYTDPTERTARCDLDQLAELYLDLKKEAQTLDGEAQKIVYQKRRQTSKEMTEIVSSIYEKNPDTQFYMIFLREFGKAQKNKTKISSTELKKLDIIKTHIRQGRHKLKVNNFQDEMLEIN